MSQHGRRGRDLLPPNGSAAKRTYGSIRLPSLQAQLWFSAGSVAERRSSQHSMAVLAAAVSDNEMEHFSARICVADLLAVFSNHSGTVLEQLDGAWSDINGSKRGQKETSIGTFAAGDVVEIDLVLPPRSLLFLRLRQTAGGGGIGSSSTTTMSTATTISGEEEPLPLPLPPPPPLVAPAHLQHMTAFGSGSLSALGAICNISAGSRCWVTAASEWTDLAKIVAAKRAFGVSSWWGDVPDVFEDDPTVPFHQRLVGNWSAVLAQECKRLRPLVANGTVTGVFVGDELVCHGVPLSNFSAVVSRLRAELGPFVVLYANECCGTVGSCDSKRRCWQGPIPSELDLISEDCYSAPCRVPAGTPYGCNASLPPAQRRDWWNVSWEIERVQMHYKSSIYPRLAAHQKVMIVPGTFGFEEVIANISVMSHNDQDGYLVELLQGMWEYAVSDPRVGGFMPWHFKERIGSAYKLGRGLGAINFNKTMRMLRRMGEAIIHNHHDHSGTSAALGRLKQDDEAAGAAFGSGAAGRDDELSPPQVASSVWLAAGGAAVISAGQSVVIASVGAILIRTKMVGGATTVRDVTQLLFWFFSPCLVIAQLTETLTMDTLSELYRLPLFSCLVSALGATVGYLVARIVDTSPDRRYTRTIVTCCACGNCVALPLSMADALAINVDWISAGTGASQLMGYVFLYIVSDSLILFGPVYFYLGGTQAHSRVQNAAAAMPVVAAKTDDGECSRLIENEEGGTASVNTDDHQPPPPPSPRRCCKVVCTQLRACLNPMLVAVFCGLLISLVSALRKVYLGSVAHQTMKIVGQASPPLMIANLGASLALHHAAPPSLPPPTDQSSLYQANKVEEEGHLPRRVICGVVFGRLIVTPLVTLVLVIGLVRVGLLPREDRLLVLFCLMQVRRCCVTLVLLTQT